MSRGLKLGLETSKMIARLPGSADLLARRFGIDRSRIYVWRQRWGFHSVKIGEADIAVLETAFDYAELWNQSLAGLPVTQKQLAIATSKILDACSEVYANNDGERPDYG